MSNITDFIGEKSFITIEVKESSVRMQGSTSITEDFPILTISQNFVVPKTGKYFVLVSGGGGSGGCAYGYSSAIHSTGGGSGGVAYGILNLTAAESISVTIGAGGAPAPSSSDGNDGGQTSFGSYLTSPLLSNKGKVQVDTETNAEFPSDGYRVADLYSSSTLSYDETVLPDVGITLKSVSSPADGVTYINSTYSVNTGGGASIITSGGAGSNNGLAGRNGSGGGGAGYGSTTSYTSGAGGDGFVLMCYLGV